MAFSPGEFALDGCPLDSLTRGFMTNFYGPDALPGSMAETHWVSPFISVATTTREGVL